MNPTVRLCAWVAVTVLVVVTPVRADYPGTLAGTGPVAYFRLEAANADPSQAGAFTSTFAGGATLAASGAPICVSGNHSVSIDGAAGSGVSTTLTGGGITTAGSIVAWVNLATLPSTAGRILYIAGESAVGNDLDLQFTTDNYVRFYAAGGSNVAYQPDAATLVGRWHMVAVTFNSTTGVKTIYWDGQLAATDNTSGNSPNKTSAFTIGQSPVFGGRNFNGAIDEVAVWNSELSAAQVTAIYAASCGGTTTSITSPAAGAASYGLQPFAVTASVTATNTGAPPSPAPTGTITISDGSASCAITLPATSCNLTPTTAGNKTLVATYGGDPNFAVSVSAGVSHIVLPGTLDVDGSTTASKYDAFTDGLLVIRYLFGLTGTSLTDGALSGTATRTDPVVIKAYLDGLRTWLDVDGNGTADALTDGLLIFRYLVGLRGSSLITGAVGSAASRMTAPDIETYLQTLMP